MAPPRITQRSLRKRRTIEDSSFQAPTNEVSSFIVLFDQYQFASKEALDKFELNRRRPLIVERNVKFYPEECDDFRMELERRE